ncbi:MAG: CocE/NonD family hydrolase, partial [Longimicrobiales bacterium]
PLDPSSEAQLLEDLCFYEAYLGRGREAERAGERGPAAPEQDLQHEGGAGSAQGTGSEQGPGSTQGAAGYGGGVERELVYKTMGEEAWKRTTEWPLPGTEMTPWYFREDGGLSPDGPNSPGEDRYTVDFTHTTGTRNRWATNNGAGDVVYPDRAEVDTRLLTYTSPPLEEDLEVTGHPVLTLYLSSTHEDGAVFAYLEDVAPDGRVRYIGEGQLRLLHRKVSEEAPPFVTPVPYHSYKESDAEPMVPAEMTEVTFALLPTSVLFRRGHRIRIAIAGADADTFARIPADGTPVWTVARSPERESRIMLPVIPR